MMDLEYIRALIEAVDESGIDSIEIDRAGTRIQISKTPPTAPAPSSPLPAPAPHQEAAPAAPAPAAEPVETASGEAPTEAGAEEDGLVEVTSPMVGTFYRAPAPEAPPYVEVGSRVTKGQTLCILEAMKLMNELECEVEGVVREILVENTEPVEYGQILFLVEPKEDGR